MKKKQATWGDRIIVGFFASICLAEGIHLTALVMKWEFHICALLMGTGFLGFAAAAAVLWALRRRKEKARRSGREKLPEREKPFPYRYPVCIALILGLLLFQIIWGHYMHQPYRKGDITVETVQTMLASDTIYQINPMTGMPFEAGMPGRLKILVLPVLYAAVCEWTGASAQTVVYEWAPTLILLLSYLVYSRYACRLFPYDRERQCLFMLFVAVLFQFGVFSPSSDGFRALFAGFTGESIRALVILPYVLLACIEKKWRCAAAGALAEICLVWTLYGLGYSAWVMGCMLAIQAAAAFWGKKRRGGMPA